MALTSAINSETNMNIMRDAVKEKITRDLKEALQKEVVDPMLDEIVRNMVEEGIDMRAYQNIDPSIMYDTFNIVIQDKRKDNT